MAWRRHAWHRYRAARARDIDAFDHSHGVNVPVSGCRGRLVRSARTRVRIWEKEMKREVVRKLITTSAAALLGIAVMATQASAQQNGRERGGGGGTMQM